MKTLKCIVLGLGIGLWSLGVGAQTVDYFHTDALGSIVAITDQSGAVTRRNEYEPFGLDLTGVEDGPGYTGHVSDAATGLSYMQQRYYDPGIGRFLSVDPVSADGNNGGNFNRYKYAANNPFLFVDPDGRQEKKEHNPVDRNSIAAKSPGAARGSSGRFASASFTRESAGQRLRAATREVNAVKDEMEAKTSKSPDGSAARFAKLMQPISTKYGAEIGASIIPVNPFNPSMGYRITGTHVSNLLAEYDGNMFIGISNYFNIHAHPVARFPGNSYDPFSLGDIQSDGWVTIPGSSPGTPRVFHYSEENGVREIPTK